MFRKEVRRMFKKLINKLGIGGVIATSGLLVAGAAFAAILITQTVSTGNSVTAGSNALQITASPISIAGLLPGGTTAPSALTIKNISPSNGDVTLNFTSVSGLLCPDLTLSVSGDVTGSVTPISNSGTINLGTVAAGATITLSQTVSRATPPTNLGPSCQWTETATFSGN